jgi:hypothetical protein
VCFVERVLTEKKNFFGVEGCGEDGFFVGLLIVFGFIRECIVA